jgi:hypothetical protein
VRAWIVERGTAPGDDCPGSAESFDQRECGIGVVVEQVSHRHEGSWVGGPGCQCRQLAIESASAVVWFMSDPSTHSRKTRVRRARSLPTT